MGPKGPTFEPVAGMGGGARIGISRSLSLDEVGSDGLVVRVDEDDLITECWEDNNEDAWPYDVCGDE